MEQPKKPGATRDIADLKARLGLAKNPAGPPGAAPMPGGAPMAGAPMGGHPGFPGAAQPMPGAPVPGAPPRGPAPGPAAPPMAAPSAAPSPAHDPFAAMRPPAGKSFDLRPIDDGMPAESVRSRGGKAGLVIGLILLVVGGGVGYGFGAAAVGRRAYNAANAAAKKVKSEVDEMQKTVTQIATAVTMSQQRLQAEKKDPFSYDAKLIEDLEKVKLDPRPDTTRIFRTDYFRLEDLAVDRLMNYYYDTIALYAEVERHIKRSVADKESLGAFAARSAEKGQANYGVVFDSRGKLAIGSLVEMGQPVCKSGGHECPADQIERFQIRAAPGSTWSDRKIGPKPAGDIVVPLDRTPLLEAVMSGSPDQARMENYRQRYRTISALLMRLNAEKKQLIEAIDKAAGRADLFTL